MIEVQEPRWVDQVLPPGVSAAPRGAGWHVDGYSWDEETGVARIRHERHGEHPVHAYSREAADDLGRPYTEMVLVKYDRELGRHTRHPAEPSPRPGRSDRWRGARPDEVRTVHQMRPSSPKHEGWEVRPPEDREAMLASYFANLKLELALAKRGAYAGPRPQGRA